nr:hypothetical protein GCM10020092_034560 [Actinoplanes digitatis]
MDGYRATQAIMATRPRPTALVVLADLMAFGAIDALHDLGLDVPGDVSVTGFDDLPEAQWTRPRLTTVRQPIVAKGRIAGDFLISAIRGEDQHQHQLLQTVLITRESSKPLGRTGHTGRPIPAERPSVARTTGALPDLIGGARPGLSTVDKPAAARWVPRTIGAIHRSVSISQ